MKDAISTAETLSNLKWVVSEDRAALVPEYVAEQIGDKIPTAIPAAVIFIYRTSDEHYSIHWRLSAEYEPMLYFGMSIQEAIHRAYCYYREQLINTESRIHILRRSLEEASQHYE